MKPACGEKGHMQYGGAEGPASSWALELVSAFWETTTSAEGRCAGVDSHGAPQIMNIVSVKRVEKKDLEKFGRARQVHRGLSSQVLSRAPAPAI